MALDVVEETGQPAGTVAGFTAHGSAAPPPERAGAAWQAATSTQAPYLVHDADPLALVADAWS
jgi:hypothetical protein